MQVIQTFFFVIVPISLGATFGAKILLNIFINETDPLAFWYSAKSLLKNTNNRRLARCRRLQNRLSAVMVIIALIYFVTYGLYLLINN
jgi:hypothetical protein